MSVPVNQRTHGKLEACVKAHELCVYTLRIASNKKIFTVEYQEALTDRIISTALMAMATFKRWFFTGGDPLSEALPYP